MTRLTFTRDIPPPALSRPAQWAIAVLAVYGFVIGVVASLTRWP